jgi:hypothetical protein
MRALTLATLFVFLPAAWTAAETSERKRRAADDYAEMRAAIATLMAIVDAASRPAAAREDAPRLLRESLRSGTADPAAMGTIVRWVLQEKEEKVAGAVADALTEVSPRLQAAQGVEAERWNAAAQSVLAAFGTALRHAEKNSRADGDEILRDLQPAIAAAAQALTEVQQKVPADPAPEK